MPDLREKVLAEGGLLNHCPACCHRITSFVWELTHPSIRAGDA